MNGLGLPTSSDDRESVGIALPVFSARLFCPFSGRVTAAIQPWEQGRRVPSTIARRFRDEMAASPEHFRRHGSLVWRPQKQVLTITQPTRRNDIAYS